MTDREKLIELLGLCDRCNAEYCNQCEFGDDIDGCVLRQKEIIADTLLANGVTFARDTNVPIKIETNVYDIEEVHHNCTVQILRNSTTGEQSIGWWPEEQPPAGYNWSEIME